MKNEKLLYQAAKLNIVILEDSDVIRTSGDGNGSISGGSNSSDGLWTPDHN